MFDIDLDQQESKRAPWVKYKPTQKGKIILILSPLLIISSVILFLLMLLSMIHGIIPLILIMSIYIILVIILMILVLDIRKFNSIYNKHKFKKSSIKEEYFVAGLIVGIFIGVFWSRLF